MAQFGLARPWRLFTSVRGRSWKGIQRDYPMKSRMYFYPFSPFGTTGYRLEGGRDTPGQKILIEGVTTCSQCIKITVAIPKECRLNAEMLGERTKQIFQKELLRDLCRGCPFEDSEA